MQTNSTPSPSTTLTLQEAVIDAVNDLKSNGSFSAHDVTTAVRESVNAGDYALPGYESTNPAFKYDVQHDAVKDVIQQLVTNGTMATLGMTSINYGGRFRTFVFDATVTAAAPAPSAVSVAPAPAAPTPAPVLVVATTTADDNSDVSESDSPVAQHIAAYLKQRGASATLKQIQSALKKNGLTCKDLDALCRGLGYTVTVVTPGSYSSYTVSAR